MFSKELEALIEATLADGVLEDNEKAALVKRAQAEGVDLGELEIYINSIMQKRMQTKTAEEEARDAAHRREQLGNRCPHCGSEMPPMTKICPNCGKAISGYETEGDKEMQSLIDQLEKFLVEVKAGDEKEYARNKATLESLMRKAETLYGQDLKIKKILFDLKEEKNKVEEHINKKAKRRWLPVIIEAIILVVFSSIFFVLNNRQQQINDRTNQVLETVWNKYQIKGSRWYYWNDLRRDRILSESEKQRRQAETESGKYDWSDHLELSEQLEKITEEDWQMVEQAKQEYYKEVWSHDTDFYCYIIMAVLLGVLIINAICAFIVKK